MNVVSQTGRATEDGVGPGNRGQERDRMKIDTAVQARIEDRLRRLYGDDSDGPDATPRAQQLLQQIVELAARYEDRIAPRPESWNERDAILITYGDQLSAAEEVPLAAQHRFLKDHGLTEQLSAVHILPCFPYSSDDGFSVIDYRQVDPALGDWQDVSRLGEDFDLMFDLVINHCSQQSEWFQKYLAGEEPYTRYFIEVDPAIDLSGVTRPRSLPLLTRQETSRGERYVWTTFSPDQIDLNFAEPAMLLEMLDVLLLYVAQGARIIRLDAIAYLWKEIGTNCIHLDQTHEVVKLMRDLLDAVAPGTLIMTETNVPHEENVSYFGQGDEAQMVYQFPLAPLLLDAFLSQDAEPLRDWLSNLDAPPPGTTYFNFTASHDGIGVRPAEGLLPEERVSAMVEAVRRRGGRVNTRRNSDGSDSPYELNITYFDALGFEPSATDSTAPGEVSMAELHVRRFLASQAIMLSLQGIPGIYFHSLVGTPNDFAGMERTGHNRSINRRKYQRPELEAILSDAATSQAQVFAGYRRMLAVRRRQPAFHPDASQQVLDVGGEQVLAVLRTSPEIAESATDMAGDSDQQILVLANVSGSHQTIETDAVDGRRFRRDLLQDNSEPMTGPIVLSPYEVVWLEVANSPD